MTRSLKCSNEHFKKAVKRIPLGVSSNFRYWGDDKTIYADHGRGSRIVDIDGNEYVEPWFISEAHATDNSLEPTLAAFEQAVDITLTKLNRN